MLSGFPQDSKCLCSTKTGVFGNNRIEVAENNGRSQPVYATSSDVEVMFMRRGRRYGLSAEQKAAHLAIGRIHLLSKLADSLKDDRQGSVLG